MKKDESSTEFSLSRPLQFAIFGVVGLGILYLIGRQAGRNSFADYKPKPLPEDANWSPDIFVEEAWSALDGYFTLSDTKEELFLKMYGLSDRQLTSIYNLYNSRYGKKDGMTLTKKIDNETYVLWGGIRSDLVKKLRNIGLN